MFVLLNYFILYMVYYACIVRSDIRKSLFFPMRLKTTRDLGGFFFSLLVRATGILFGNIIPFFIFFFCEYQNPPSISGVTHIYVWGENKKKKKIGTLLRNTQFYCCGAHGL